jgi:hypothetical protein
MVFSVVRCLLSREDMKLRKPVLALSVLLFTSSAGWAEDSARVTQPMKMGDARFSCDNLIAEATSMEQIMGGTPQGSILGSDQAMGLATDAAMRAGGYRAAGAMGTVGSVFKGFGKRKKREQAEQKKIAELRWYYMVGLYQGMDCDSAPVAEPAPVSDVVPVAASVPDAESVSVPEPAVVSAPVAEPAPVSDVAPVSASAPEPAVVSAPASNPE